MWMRNILGLRQFLMKILKSNKPVPVMHINLFVLERSSCRYLARLNRSSVEEVIAITRTMSCPETFTRPGELLHCKFTRPGMLILR